MRNRLPSILLVTVLLLLFAAPSALASTKFDSGPVAKGHVKVSLDHPGNGASHALQNSEKGQNRQGIPGTWGPNGHTPATISFPQGHSPSDPDDGGNGGLDKPGFTGGFNSDRDGNNGCGNDSDREDDNNGWCGRKPHHSKPVPPPVPPPVVVPPPVTVGPPPVVRSGGSSPTRVLGVTIRAQAALPKTGFDPTQGLISGWGSLLVGVVIKRRAGRAPRR